MARQLFAAMRTGGMVGFERVERFNGGLFDDDAALPLSRPQIAAIIDKLLSRLARTTYLRNNLWSLYDPTPPDRVGGDKEGAVWDG